MRKLLVLSASLLVPMLLPAVPVSFTGSSAAGSASALFDTSGSNLAVTLTNTATTDALIQTHILTGVFFNFASGAAPALTTVSAVLGSGGVVYGNGGATGAGGSVGGEWAYKGGISTHGQDRGISSAALGVFGPGDVFPGSGNLEGPPSPNGIQYGITTAGDNPVTCNGGV